MTFQVELTRIPRAARFAAVPGAKARGGDYGNSDRADHRAVSCNIWKCCSELKVDDVGDFVEMASTLIEIKSRSVLPRSEEIEEPLEDPRQDLVRRLLEYKEFKDAASMLEERGRQWQEHFPRLASDLPPRNRNPAEEPIHEVELWDLVSAFGRILREQAASQSVEHRVRRHAD